MTKKYHFRLTAPNAMPLEAVGDIGFAGACPAVTGCRLGIQLQPVKANTALFNTEQSDYMFQ